MSIYSDPAATIKRFSNLKVVVLGDIMLDIYEFCFNSASKPIESEKAGKRAYTAQKTVKTLGGAGNVAANLSSLGVQSVLIGVTGNDGHYFTLQQIADDLGIRHCFIRDRQRPTTSKSRLYIDNQYLLRRDEESSAQVSHETALTLVNETLCELDGASALILSDYNKGLFREDLARAVIDRAKERRIPIIVDFKPANAKIFAGATVISPNSKEAEELLPGFNQGDFENSLPALRDRLRCDSVVVTLGDRGICGIDDSGCFHVPANAVEEVDAVGCGDTVRAVLAVGRALGLSLDDAAALANDAAAVIVQKPATAMVTSDELLSFISAKAQ